MSASRCKFPGFRFSVFPSSRESEIKGAGLGAGGVAGVPIKAAYLYARNSNEFDSIQRDACKGFGGAKEERISLESCPQESNPLIT